MKQSYWLLCIAKNCDWSRKITSLSKLARTSLLVEWKLTGEAELRNLLILKKMLEKSGQFLSSEQPFEPKSLDVVLNIAGVEKIPSENLWLRSTEVIWFEFWMKGALVTVGIFVFCGWWLSNRFDIMSETHLSCWPWAVVNYTLLAAVPWNGLVNSHRKARLCVYFKLSWF